MEKNLGKFTERELKESLKEVLESYSRKHQEDFYAFNLYRGQIDPYMVNWLQSFLSEFEYLDFDWPLTEEVTTPSNCLFWGQEFALLEGWWALLDHSSTFSFPQAFNALLGLLTGFLSVNLNCYSIAVLDIDGTESEYSIPATHGFNPSELSDTFCSHNSLLVWVPSDLKSNQLISIMLSEVEQGKYLLPPGGFCSLFPMHQHSSIKVHPSDNSGYLIILTCK